MGTLTVLSAEYILSLTQGQSHTVRKDDIKLEKSPFPQSLILAWNAALPFLQIEHTLGISLGFCKEAEWVITAPLFAAVGQAIPSQRYQVLADSPFLLKPILTKRHGKRLAGLNGVLLVVADDVGHLALAKELWHAG